MRTISAILLGLAPALLYAATPAEGTLNLDTLSLEYTAGPFVNANTLHQSDSGASGPTCLSPVLACDDFALTLDFPEGVAEVYPSAVVKIAWAWEDISGAGLIDFDCWVFDGEENLLETSGAGSNNPESAGFLLYGGEQHYILRCAPFLALGDSFTGTVEVALGDPVEPPAEDESEMAGFMGVLVPSESGDEPEAESRSSQSRSGSGALGWSLLLLGGLRIVRRRR